MKTLFILPIVILFVSSSQAQLTFERLYQFDNDHSNGYCVFQNYDKSYIIAGSLGTNSSLHKILVFKTNEWGDTIWSKTFGDTIYNYYQAEAFSCLMTNDSSILVCGWNYNSAILLKLDPEGSTIWSKQVGTLSDTEMGFSVKKTFEGGYIITGLTHTYNGRNDLYLVKTDQNGDTIWTKTYGESWLSEAGNDVIQTADSGFLAVGYSHSDSTWLDKVLLVKTDQDGNLQWLRRLGNSNQQNNATSISLTFDNCFIITGSTGDYSSNAVLLLKLDQNGDTIWKKEILPPNSGYANGNSIKVLSENDYIITGGSGSGMFLLRTDSSGNIIWCHNFQETWTTGNEVSLTDDFGYIIAGYCWNPAYFVDRVYLVKTNENGLITGKKPQEKQHSLIAFPNPCHEKLTILANNEILCLDILNSLGQKVYEFSNNKSSNKISIDFSKQLPGLYTIIITTNYGRSMKKIIHF